MAEDCAVQFHCRGHWFEFCSSLGFSVFFTCVTLNWNDPCVVPLLTELVHLQNYWFKRKDVSKMAYLKLYFLAFSVIDVPWKFRQKLSGLLHVTRTFHSTVCAYSSQGLEKPHLDEGWAIRMPERYACSYSLYPLCPQWLFFRFCEQHPGGKARRAGCDYCVSPGIFAQKSLSPVVTI